MKLLLAIFSCTVALASAPATIRAQDPPATPASAPTVPAHDPKYGIYPIGYREIIARWLESRLLDAGSAKIEYEEPKPIEVAEKGSARFVGYSVEFRVNSRNKFGSYTGFQRHRVLIRNGDIMAANRVRN